MNVLRIVRLLGWLLVALAAAQLVPVLAALIDGEPALPYLASAIAAGVCGAPIVVGVRPDDQRARSRDGFVLAVSAWLIASAFGALPFVMAGVLHPVDAWYESVAGFTTTASSALGSLESVPRALLLWRSMTQWLGGLGVVVVSVWLLPTPGIGSVQLFASGGSREAGTEGTSVAAKALLAVYLALTAAAIAALWIAGLGGFDALCHALTSVSTGGFSTRDGSIGAFGSPAVEWVLVVVMFLGATSFALMHGVVIGRDRSRLADEELRCYAGAAIAASAVLVVALEGSVGESLRPAVFQAVSMLSGTGYRSQEFSGWNALPQFVLLAAMTLGGMSGSTTGGLKSLRVLLGFRALRDSFTALLHPHSVSRVKYAGHAVPDETLGAIWAFFTAYFAIVGFGAVLVAAAGYDLPTAVSVALSTTANVGPALGAAGDGVLSPLPGSARIGLTFCMLAGRLDVFTLLVVLLPRFWRQ